MTSCFTLDNLNNSRLGSREVREVHHRILIADDEPAVRDLLCDLLGHSGYEVVGAADGGEALRKLAETDFDLVICDILMPEVDGLELIIQVKNEHPDVAIIAMSALTNHLHLRCARSLGA